MIRGIFLMVVFVAGFPSLLFAQQQIHSSSDDFGKIAPSLKNMEVKSVRVQVTNKSTFIEWMKIHFPNVKIEEERLPNVYRINVNRFDDIRKLAESSSVKYIDRGNRTPVEEKALGAFDFTLNKIRAVQNLYDVTGDNLVVSIKEKPFDPGDIDLKNRVVINGQFDEPSTLHATYMATIIAGGGNSEPSGQGVAPGAEVTTSDFLQLLPDDGQVLENMGVTTQNHSYGVGVENYYGIETAAYDDHCHDFFSMMHIFSSGNEGDKLGSTPYGSIPGFANLTGQFKVSKNTLCVGSADVSGNVTIRSSRGPAYDGRIKPELVAYGDAGSSEAAAVVSGISLLIQQKYRDQIGELPPSSLVKAVLINSSDDVGRSQVDFETGFGNADALGAIRTIEQQKFFIGSTTQGGENIFSINVPVNANALKVTLVWNDVEAIPNATVALVNDLDLEVRHNTSGVKWKPWVLSHYPLRDSLTLVAKRKEDHLNNVEQTTIDLPECGDYDIIVKGFSVPQGPQAFSLAFETESGFEWTNPTVGTSFAANRDNFIRWRWSGPQAIGKLEYKSVDKAGWTEIKDNIRLSGEYIQWLTPDSTLLIQLRMTVNNTIYESEEFTIVKPIALKVGYNCDDETMLVWSPMDEADQYQLFRLGEKYLEPFLLTTDTFAILNSEQKEVLEYAVSPVMQGMNGLKGTTVDYTQAGTECYFINFLPRQYVVVDDAIFDLTVGTTYKLNFVILERLMNGAPVEIQRISPTSTNIVLHDNNPEPGLNQYRARLEGNNQKLLYVSNYEQIFYVRNQDIFVFPNPITSGEVLNIVVNDLGTVRLRVYDAMGRLMEEITDSGSVKTIDTTTFIRGAYIVEVVKTDGTRLTMRLMVI